jgi:hypothetical protein
MATSSLTGTKLTREQLLAKKAEIVKDVGIESVEMGQKRKQNIDDAIRRLYDVDFELAVLDMQEKFGGKWVRIDKTAIGKVKDVISCNDDWVTVQSGKAHRFYVTFEFFVEYTKRYLAYDNDNTQYPVDFDEFEIISAEMARVEIAKAEKEFDEMRKRFHADGFDRAVNTAMNADLDVNDDLPENTGCEPANQ